ncbi:MAG: FG-GAP-like repeat-containing protein, partial [Pyrinomonadaceae bacterium]
TAPLLPAGWTTTNVGANLPWVTSTTTPNSAPNAAFTNDPSTAGESSLVSPDIAITSANAQINFRHSFVTEATFDGGVLEISIGGGAFQDILAAGGSFSAGGYTSVLSNFASCSATPNPIATRQAWNGNSAGYITTSVNIPAAANGQNVKFRWRFGSDCSAASTGWRVDNVEVVNGFSCAVVAVKSRSDFDGDGKTDLSVFRPTEGNWYLNRSTAGFQVLNWGISTDTLVPGDYDGDGKADTAIFRPSNSAGVPDFYILNSNGFTYSGAEWGLTGDKAVVGNFDGDSKDDIAIWRDAGGTGTFYILNSSNGSNTIAALGTTGDIPLSMDTDNDGKTNLAVFRPSNNTWYIMHNSGGIVDAFPFGLAGDKIVPADYDNDNKTDIAVYRNGQWIIKRSSDGVVSFLSWGNSTDVPVPGDYDGDGADDLAIYRNGTWYINRSTSGALVQPFGVTSDKPVPTAYIP